MSQHLWVSIYESEFLIQEWTSLTEAENNSNHMMMRLYVSLLICSSLCWDSGATHAVIFLISCRVSKTQWGVIWLELKWQNFEIWQWRTFNEFQVNQTFSIPNWDQKEFKKIIRKIFVLIELEMDSFSILG